MISVDHTSPVPPFEQVRAGIAGQIRSGALGAGARLPSVRQLAGDLRLAPGTVARAYHLLALEGLVVTNRASGTRVRAGQATASAVPDAAACFARTARSAGLSLEEAVAALRARW